jgi:hypothetical protein
MKIRLLLTSIAYLLLSASTYSQTQEKGELQISFGPLARNQIATDILLNIGRTLLREPIRNVAFSKKVSATYRYQTSKKLVVGFNAGIGWGDASKKYLFAERFNYRHKSYMMSFEAKFNYISKPNIELYYFAGGGGVLIRERRLDLATNQYETFMYPTFQITPFGVRAGKQTGVFAEIGYGYKGIINLGLSSRF